MSNGRLSFEDARPSTFTVCPRHRPGAVRRPHARCFHLLLVALGSAVFAWGPPARATAISAPEPPAISVSRLQVPFVENQGQVDPEFTHYAVFPNATWYLSRGGKTVLALSAADRGTPRNILVHETLEGARQTKIGEPREQSERHEGSPPGSASA